MNTGVHSNSASLVDAVHHTVLQSKSLLSETKCRFALSKLICTYMQEILKWPRKHKITKVAMEAFIKQS